MSDIEDQNPIAGAEDDRIAGDGSGDPNSDRAFLQGLPPAQDQRLDDSEVDVTDPLDEDDLDGE